VSSIDVVLADDHPIVLAGLDQLFGSEPGLVVRARCTTGEETLEAVRRLCPRVLVLDLRMPDGDGLSVLRSIQAEGLPTRVVLLTASLSDEQLVEALQLGVQGVVLKEMAPRLLAEAVRTVARGASWLEDGLGTRALRKLLHRDAALREATQKLTSREVEIVKLVAQGHRNRVIAEQLFISEGTVKVHLHNIYEKLKVDGRLALAVYAQNHGLI
jgi:DNA-binding NarL/FixJ family response regulator